MGLGNTYFLVKKVGYQNMGEGQVVTLEQRVRRMSMSTPSSSVAGSRPPSSGSGIALAHPKRASALEMLMGNQLAVPAHIEKVRQ